MMAHKSRPSLATGPSARRPGSGRARTAALLAGTILAVGLGAGAHAQGQYSPYGNPLAGGPVPYSQLQGGTAAQPYGQQGYGQAYGAPYGGAQVSSGGAIVYDRSVLGGGGYQAPFYAGARTGFQQPGVQYGGAVPFGAPAQPSQPSGAYGQAGGLLVPGPTAPRSQLYIQPGVAAPGFAQTQAGIANGTLPPAPPAGTQTQTQTQTATTRTPTSTPQVSGATTPLPPATPDVAPAPAPQTPSSTGPSRVPVIVEDTSPPPAPPEPPSSATSDTTPVSPPPAPTRPEDTRTVEDILQPPPPPDDPEIAAATPPTPPTPTSEAPAQTPEVRSDAPPPPPETPDPPAQTPEVPEPPVQTQDVPDEPGIAAVDTPPASPPAATTDGGVALSVSFAGGSSELPSGSDAELRTIAQQMNADDSLRLTIRAYAEGSAEEASQARRLSLSRALAVRSFLIEQGIRGPRMDVRALGHRIEPPRDRVDLVLVAQ